MPSFPVADQSNRRIARRLKLSGRVQGLGVRPAIARLAADCSVAGAVSNRLEGVQIEIEGPPDRIEQFQRRLSDSLPPAAQVEGFVAEEIPSAERCEFHIEEAPVTGLVRTQVPQDLAVCGECLTEVASEGNRRHAYPFTSCTNCGPRYSIIDAMPFERANTRMAQFVLCPTCRAEYGGAADRRFHSQANACPDCGPQIWCGERNGRLIARHRDAMETVVAGLLRGQIVAVRGIGGYQLVCDATSDQAVARLRARKRRSKKPLAVMVLDLPSAERLATVDSASRTALVGSANPIVLLPPRVDNGLATAIHPGLDSVGLLLPTTPLHWLLLRDCGRPLVVTSGNREGEPLAVDIDEALDRLRDVADLWLHHDRPIARPVDDSVVRIIAGRPVTLRLARGLAPLSLDLPATMPAVALGGEQKSAIALSNAAQAVLGPHVGDLGSVRSRERYENDVSRAIELYGTAFAQKRCLELSERLKTAWKSSAPRYQTPFLGKAYGTSRPLWIHDLHPDYFTTQWAQDQFGQRVAVQHHHAHVASTMLEQGWLDREVLGVAFDGTGYGSNATIWGGEFLLATTTSFRRVAHLREFQLPGGEAAIREPWRVAVALVQQEIGAKALSRIFSGTLLEKATRLLPLLNRPQLSPRTSSVGRLFDGIAALALGIERAEFEGYPAMQLEAAADPTVTTAYTFAVEERDPLQLDGTPMIAELVSDLRKGTPAGTIAMRFHRGLALAMSTICRRFAPRPIALGGGVFQNRLLTELFLESMTDSNQSVGLPGRIPPNDGGLAAGQLAVGLALTGRKGS